MGIKQTKIYKIILERYKSNTLQLDLCNYLEDIVGLPMIGWMWYTQLSQKI